MNFSKLLAIPLIAACVGCSSKSPIAAATPDCLAVTGPGGIVRIGDDLAKAKAAFPSPAGSLNYDKSLSFAILGVDGWAWASEKSERAFEVGLRNGKVIAINVTNLSGPQPDAEQKEITALGAPARKAENDKVAMLVWEKGNQARFLIHMRKKNPFFGEGTMTTVGAKDDLKLLNYRADDPETFVKQMDATAAFKP